MFTDICEQMRMIMTPGQQILNDGGIKKYISCLDQNFQENVTQQIQNIALGEYILLEQINFELAEIAKKSPGATDPPVKSITDLLSRTYLVTDPNLVYFRDLYTKQANLTNIVKKKLLRLPACYYLNSWGVEFNQKICNENLMASYSVYKNNLTLAAQLYIYCLVMFYLDRYIMQVKEIDRVENIQLYMRVPSTQNPLYRLN